jgi:phage tail sheath protein FI
LDAENEGEWGNTLRATTDLDTADTSDTNLFNLTIQRLSGTTITDNVVATETFRNVSIDPNSPRFVTNVLANRSSYARVNTLPGALIAGSAMFVGGDDGTVLTATEYEGSLVNRTGIYALEKADLFNILCIPPFTLDASTDTTPWDDALAYCKQRRAMLIVNPHPDWTTPDDVADDSNNNTTGIFNHRDENSVMYFPRLRMPDSLQENRLAEFVPCGVMAGVMARTDAQRGVWKAPAGIDASLVGVRELSYKMTDGDNGKINPIGVNALRTFPVIGNVGWGARTLEGADRLASEWKYVPVRRLALFIEESLYRGTQWVVFEPNDEPLWAQIRLNIGAFMHNLFRQGAFQGSSPRDAYFVKCDSSTTTQNDIDQGIVNILVGFAPLKPAEFVMIKISQIAGNIEF